MSRPRPSLPVTPLVTALLVAALALALGAPADARGAKRRPRKPTVTAAAPVQAPAPAGAVIAVDPETGRLGMPSAAQMLELSAAERTGLLRSSAGLESVRLPDGSWMVDLQGRFQSFTVVRLDALGGRRFVHADEPSALWRALTAPPAHPLPEER